MATKEEFWDRKQKLNDDFSVIGSIDKPATKKQISQYEKETGFKLSEDFKDFLLTFGTLIFEVKEEIWKRPKVNDVLPAWKLGYGFFVYGLSRDKDMPAWMSYPEKHREALKYKDKPVGQLFFKRSGNVYRAYTNSGVIKIEYDKYDANDVMIFGGNIYDFLISEIDKLDHDYNKYIKETASERQSD
jgi:hypothetical protein